MGPPSAVVISASCRIRYNTPCPMALRWRVFRARRGFRHPNALTVLTPPAPLSLGGRARRWTSRCPRWRRRRKDAPENPTPETCPMRGSGRRPPHSTMLDTPVLSHTDAPRARLSYGRNVTGPGNNSLTGSRRENDRSFTGAKRLSGYRLRERLGERRTPRMPRSAPWGVHEGRAHAPRTAGRRGVTPLLKVTEGGAPMTRNLPQLPHLTGLCNVA